MDNNRKGLKDSFADALVSFGPGLAAAMGTKDPMQIYNAYIQGVTAMDKAEEDRFNRSLKVAQLNQKLMDKGRPSYDMGFVDKKSGQVLKLDKNTGNAYTMQGEIFDRPEDIVEGETYRLDKSLPYRDRAVNVSETRVQLEAAKATQLTPKEVDRLGSINQVKYQLHRIRNLKEGADTGPIANLWGKFTATFKPEWTPKNFNELRVETESLLANYIKSMSGVQTSAAERNMLMNVVPRMNDDDDTFLAKIKQFEKIVEVGGQSFLEAISTGSPLKRDTVDLILNTMDPRIPKKTQIGDDEGQLKYIRALRAKRQKPELTGR